MPDVKRALDELREEMRSQHGELLSRVDGIYHRLDRLETEYHLLTAAVARIEKRLHELVDVRHEIEDLKSRVSELQERIAQLEAKAAAAAPQETPP